jgi:hypothetical protein
MRAGLSFSYPPISLLLRQPLSIKKSYAGAIQLSFIYKKICTQLRIFQKEIKSTLNQELMHILGERGKLVRVIII